jgi:hypothetical protein
MFRLRRLASMLLRVQPFSCTVYEDPCQRGSPGWRRWLVTPSAGKLFCTFQAVQVLCAYMRMCTYVHIYVSCEVQLIATCLYVPRVIPTKMRMFHPPPANVSRLGSGRPRAGCMVFVFRDVRSTQEAYAVCAITRSLWWRHRSGHRWATRPKHFGYTLLV